MKSSNRAWLSAFIMISLFVIVAVIQAQDVNPLPDQGEPTMTLTASPTLIPTAIFTLPPPVLVSPRQQVDEIPTQPPPPQVFPPVVAHIEPSQFSSTAGGTVSVIGSNFTADSAVRLIGYGFLATSFVNAGAITATIPQGLAAGLYGIEVVSPSAGSAASPIPLTIFAPAPTAGPTQPPPTQTPGRPLLIVSSFDNASVTATPGSGVNLFFQIVNQGNRTATGVSVSLGTGSVWSPSNGQASVPLPPIPPGGTVDAAIAVTASSQAVEGANDVPLVFSYQDSQGEFYTSNATLSVNVQGESPTQLTIGGYRITPEQPTPGQAVNVMVRVTNAGAAPARQLLLRLSGEDRVLLPGPQGDTFPLGELAPGESIDLNLPLQVNRSAEAGPQAQEIILSYIQDGEVVQASNSFTVSVAASRTSMLLTRYETSLEVLQPGDRFTLTADIQNLGNEAVEDVNVIFGQVEAAPPDSGSGGSGSGSGGVQPSSSGNSFSPLNSGGVMIVGSVGANETFTVSQEFVVSPTLSSGVYSLPLTVRYTRANGAQVRDGLVANVIVVARPRLQIMLRTPLPESVMVGEMISLNVRLANLSTAVLNLLSADITTDNGEVNQGMTTQLSLLNANENVQLTSAVTPDEEGEIHITVTVRYLDELNQERTVDSSFSTVVMPMPEMPEEIPPPIEEIPMTPTPDPDDLIGEVLLGFLGLGG